MKETLFRSIFKKGKPVIGTIRVFDEDRQTQLLHALRDLEILQRYVDGVAVVNYGWGFYDSNFAIKEMAETLLTITAAVARKAKIPVGINVLPNDYEYAFRIAKKTGASFVQMYHITGEFTECKPVDADEFLLFRSCYPKIALLGGIHPKYCKLADPRTLISESAMIARNLCDAIVVSGETISLEDLETVKQAVGDHPVLIGSGFTAKGAKAQLTIADGAIVGTAFRVPEARPNDPVDEESIVEVMNIVEGIRKL